MMMHIYGWHLRMAIFISDVRNSRIKHKGTTVYIKMQFCESLTFISGL